MSGPRPTLPRLAPPCICAACPAPSTWWARPPLHRREQSSSAYQKSPANNSNPPSPKSNPSCLPCLPAPGPARPFFPGGSAQDPALTHAEPAPGHQVPLALPARARLGGDHMWLQDMPVPPAQPSTAGRQCGQSLGLLTFPVSTHGVTRGNQVYVGTRRAVSPGLHSAQSPGPGSHSQQSCGHT